MRPTPSALALAVLIASVAPAADPPECAKGDTQLELNLCARARLEQADRALNDRYRTVSARLEAAHRTKFTAAQRAWIAFRDASCDAELWLSRDGSIHPMAVSACRERLTRQRIEDLHQLEVETGEP